MIFTIGAFVVLNYYLWLNQFLYIKQTEAKGAVYFEGRETPAFGVLTAKEWCTQFYKHIDHHFTQFGV